jgi:hypothetical protein
MFPLGVAVLFGTEGGQGGDDCIRQRKKLSTVWNEATVSSMLSVVAGAGQPK